MQNETLASEIIKDMLNEKSTILMELECLDVDFDKAAFVLTGVQETMESMQEPKTLEDGLVYCIIDKQLNITGLSNRFVVY